MRVVWVWRAWAAASMVSPRRVRWRRRLSPCGTWGGSVSSRYISRAMWRLRQRMISRRVLPSARRVGAGNSAVVVDLPRWGPMLSPRVPNLVPIPGPRVERETPGQRLRPNYGHPHAWLNAQTDRRGEFSVKMLLVNPGWIEMWRVSWRDIGLRVVAGAVEASDKRIQDRFWKIRQCAEGDTRLVHERCGADAPGDDQWSCSPVSVLMVRR